ncbi:MAG: M48 family metallopeptidase [Schwartzia sp. (in: firmicutes)]
MGLFQKKTKMLRQKAAALAAAAVFSLSIGSAPTVEAGWGSIIGAGIQAGVQYALVDNAMKHYDGEGRAEFFDMMQEKYGVNEDEELNERLDVIMGNLSRAIARVDPSITQKPYNYFINTDESFNAFCSLGHNISVNTGMFNLVANDDEVAVVLGHEMGHGQKEHVRKSLKGTLNASILGSIVAEATGVEALGNILVNNISAVHVTKPQEWEADNLAFDYIIQSDYNPGACAAIWQRVMDQYGSGSKNFVGDIFNPSDHPSHKERRDSYAKKLAEYSGGKVKIEVKDDVATVRVNGKDFIAPSATENMSGNERAYFVAGALAKAYHNGTAGEAYASDDTVYFGDQAVVSPIGADASAEELAALLNRIK